MAETNIPVVSSESVERAALEHPSLRHELSDESLYTLQHVPVTGADDAFLERRSRRSMADRRTALYSLTQLVGFTEAEASVIRHMDLPQVQTLELAVLRVVQRRIDAALSN